MINQSFSKSPAHNSTLESLAIVTCLSARLAMFLAEITLISMAEAAHSIRFR